MFCRHVLLALLILVPAVTSAMIPLFVHDNRPLVTVDAELRPRYAIDARDMNDATAPVDYGTLRSVIGVNVTPDPSLLLRVAMQESRLLGSQQVNSAPTAQLFMQEAYLQLFNVFDLPIALKAGRFSYQHGRGRIIGRNDWRTYGPNAFDGVQLSLAGPTSRWDLLALNVLDGNYAGWIDTHYPWLYNPVPGSPFSPSNPSVAQSNQRRYLFIAGGQLLGGMLQPLFYADISSGYQGRLPFYYMRNKEQYIAAAYLGDEFGDVTVNLDLAYQWLTLDYDYVFTDETGRELGSVQPTEDSFLLAAELSWTPTDLGMLHEVGLGFDRVFGEYELSPIGAIPVQPDGTYDLPDRSNFPRFETPFMNTHKFHGMMDYDWSTIPKLTDLFGRVAVEPTADLTVSATYHRFLIEDYNPEGNDETVDLAQEVDIQASWTANRWLTVHAGYGIFDLKRRGDVTRWYNPAWQILGGEFQFSHDAQAEYGFLQATVRF